MPAPRVLISGASVAGPTLSYWLVKAGCSVTVVERAPTLRLAGQGIDVQNAARDVVKRMGIFERLRERSSQEEGTEFIGTNGNCLAKWGVDLSGKGISITNDIEILRGEMAQILIDVTKDDVSYIFDEMVRSADEKDDKVAVQFANGTPAAEFDLVVAADGIASKLRNMVCSDIDRSSQIKSMKSYAAYCSIPRNDTDTMWSKVHWFDRGRNSWLRPDNQGRMRAYLLLAVSSDSDPRLARLESALKADIPTQKALFQDLFQDLGWEVPRVLEGMHAADDFYMQHIAQVQVPRWSTPGGRIALIGDAAYAPSPYNGGGASLAFIGAYVLAGEISRRPNDIPAAVAAYEQILRPFVEDAQKLPPGVPWIALPQSQTGVRVLEGVIRGVSMLANAGMVELFRRVASWLPTADAGFKLPKYDAFDD